MSMRILTHQLAVATFQGAAELAARSGEAPEVMRQRVTSQGGTTHAAITHLQAQQVPAHFVAAMRQALKNIQTGDYAKRFILEGKTNYPEMTARRRLNAEHPIEIVGEKLRDMMPWIKANKLVDKSRN